MIYRHAGSITAGGQQKRLQDKLYKLRFIFITHTSQVDSLHFKKNCVMLDNLICLIFSYCV